jgi:transcriptional regulator with XRE-family HTH domain
MNLKKADINIGTIIKRQAKKKGVKNEELAKLLNCHYSNIYHIYKKENICTELLWKLSIILEYNFFKFVYGLDMDGLLSADEEIHPTTIIISKNSVTFENGSLPKTEYRRIYEK